MTSPCVSSSCEQDSVCPESGNGAGEGSGPQGGAEGAGKAEKEAQGELLPLHNSLTGEGSGSAL